MSSAKPLSSAGGAGAETAQVAPVTVRHVVLLRFKPDTSSAEVAAIETAFATLAGQIDEILALEWGTNHSPEGLDHGYTHCFSLGFADTAARDRYLVHPTHQAFSALAGPVLTGVLVIDHDIRH